MTSRERCIELRDVFNAYCEGKKIEWRHKGGEGWIPLCDVLITNFWDDNEYRVAPGQDVSDGNTDDPVNHPRHYTSCGAKCRKCDESIEAIDVIEHFSLLRGNSMKYLWRAGLKGDALVDLRKARWYLDREISSLESEQ